MKHAPSVIVVLLGLFLVSQWIGLGVLYRYIDVDASRSSGVTRFREMELAGVPFERPQVQEGTSFVLISIALMVGTALMLILIRLGWMRVWKAWFVLAVAVCVGIALAAFVPSWIALAVGSVVALVKVARPNFWVHMFGELFVYAGLAVIFVPIMNLTSVLILMGIISVYDMYAVWRSKHMIVLAKAQAEQRLFAGLVVPYQRGRLSAHLPAGIGGGAHHRSVHATSSARVSPGSGTAILGGGDIGFPLLFSGVVLKSWGVPSAVVIPFFAAAALAVLFMKGEQGRFYPAMPVLSVGCLAGLLVASLI